MQLIALSINGFRGIQHVDIHFGEHVVIVGPNGAGKSTIVDSLSLVFGRTRMVRDLTEHDFYGSCTLATSRIRIIATLAGFENNDPDRYENWFREGRAVPKWWNPIEHSAEPEQNDVANILCAQIAFVARFDRDELVVETLRYFFDDEQQEDPFLEDTVQQVPISLLDEIGYYVLPARRTWEATASFASELFRKTVATVGGIPSQSVLDERDRLRRPHTPLETDAGLLPLVERINIQLAQLLPAAPQFQLRVTATDSDSLLRALVPHYTNNTNVSLPVVRHGMGLLSLQTFILLLELGRERRCQRKPFMLAMEEPELHIPPGIQRRLIAQALSISNQTICTSHSPRIAAFYPSTSVHILNCASAGLTCMPLLESPLSIDERNAIRKLYNDNRQRVIEALMQHKVLIPEGRSDFEWFRILTDVIETGDQALQAIDINIPSFNTVVGVVPTDDAAVLETYSRLRLLRDGIVPLVDGDGPGNIILEELKNASQAPTIIIQWRDGLSIEDAIGWILNVDEDNVIEELRECTNREFTCIEDLVSLMKVNTGPSRLKGDYIAYEAIASVICKYAACRERAHEILKAITLACLGQFNNSELLHQDDVKSTVNCIVLRI